MIFSKQINMPVSIININFQNGQILLQLNNGTYLKDDLKKFPKLFKASNKELSEYELWDNGKWIHWEKLNEDLGLEGFLKNKT